MFYAVNKAMGNNFGVNNIVGLFVMFLPRVALFGIAILHNVIVATKICSWVSRVLLR